MMQILWVLALPLLGLANPYPDPAKVPVSRTQAGGARLKTFDIVADPRGLEVLRVRIDFDSSTGSFHFGGAVRENSGTPALVRRARHQDPRGSFRAELRDETSDAVIAHDSIGTGQEFRQLARALSFRFPVPANNRLKLVVFGENAQSGKSEVVLEERLAMSSVPTGKTREDVSVHQIAAARNPSRLLVNIYAEGYTAARKQAFLDAAARVVTALEKYKLPLLEHLEFRAVFATSNERLGSAKNLGHPIPERDSFLGLYYPYWRDFFRWYHVVYPTREERFRAGLAAAAYDYPIVLVDSDSYWGVGNYRELTAIPAGAGQFDYLLVHELGHFFGLNEEYEGGGPTELQFAPGIDEPWSQNITFLRDRSHDKLKWNALVLPSTPLPTPRSHWNSASKPVYGAYLGGYGDSEPRRTSHKPGLGCVMDHYRDLCAVCLQGISDVIRFDLAN